MSGRSMINGIRVGLDLVDGRKAWVVTIEASVQKVALVAVNIHRVVKFVACGANVVQFQNPTLVNFLLNAKELWRSRSGLG